MNSRKLLQLCAWLFLADVTYAQTPPAQPPPPQTRSVASASARGQMTFVAVAYDISSKDLEGLKRMADPALKPQAALATLATPANARLVKPISLLVIAGRSGQHIATKQGGGTLEIEPVVGPDGVTVDATTVLTTPAGILKSEPVHKTKLGETIYLGTLPGSSADRNVLWFLRICVQ